MTESVMPSSTIESASGAAANFPWPPAAGVSSLGAFFRTWRESTFKPSAFFRAMPVPGPSEPAVLYYFVVGVGVAIIQLAWQMMFALAFGALAYFTELYEMFGVRVDALSPILGFLFTPLILAVALVLVLALVHATLWLTGGARNGAATTLRVLCYAASPQVFAIIPFIGWLVASVWTIATTIIGLREAHRTDDWRAAMAVLLPVAAFFALVVFLGILAAVLIGLGV